MACVYSNETEKDALEIRAARGEVLAKAGSAWVPSFNDPDLRPFYVPNMLAWYLNDKIVLGPIGPSQM